MPLDPSEIPGLDLNDLPPNVEDLLRSIMGEPKKPNYDRIREHLPKIIVDAQLTAGIALDIANRMANASDGELASAESAATLVTETVQHRIPIPIVEFINAMHICFGAPDVAEEVMQGMHDQGVIHVVDTSPNLYLRNDPGSFHGSTLQFVKDATPDRWAEDLNKEHAIFKTYVERTNDQDMISGEALMQGLVDYVHDQGPTNKRIIRDTIERMIPAPQVAEVAMNMFNDLNVFEVRGHSRTGYGFFVLSEGGKERFESAMQAVLDDMKNDPKAGDEARAWLNDVAAENAGKDADTPMDADAEAFKNQQPEY